MMEHCIACATVSRSFVPPGGVIFETHTWMIVLRAKPVQFPCLPLIILKRHCEDMAELHPKESAVLGQLMQLTAQGLNQVVQPAKVYFGIYADEVKHIHVHVFPRMSNMPVGNLPNVWRNQWLTVLYRFGLKKAYPDAEVTDYAERLRAAYLKLSKDSQEQI